MRILYLGLLAAGLTALVPHAARAQLSRQALVGVWYTPAADSAYYQATTLTLVSDPRALPDNLCKYTTWEIQGGRFKLVWYDNCERPDEAFAAPSKKRWHLSQMGNRQVIRIQRQGEEVDSFEVLKLDTIPPESGRRLLVKRLQQHAHVY